MATKTLAGQRHWVAWSAGSRGWGARGRRIETRGSHHIIARPISRQIGFSASGVRVNSLFPESSFLELTFAQCNGLDLFDIYLCILLQF